MVKGKKPIKKDAGRKKKIENKKKPAKNNPKEIFDKNRFHPLSLEGISKFNEELGGFRLGSPFSENVSNLNNTFDELIPNTKSAQNKALRELQLDMQKMLSIMEKLKNQNEKMYRDILRIGLTVSKLHVTGEQNLDLFQKIESMLDEYLDGTQPMPTTDDTPDWFGKDN